MWYMVIVSNCAMVASFCQILMHNKQHLNIQYYIDIADDIQENEYNAKDVWDNDIHNSQGQDLYF